MTLDERIRTNLEAAANAVPRSEPDSIANIKKRGVRRRRNRRIAWSAGISLLVIGSLYLVNPLQGAEDTYLADGETLLATRPTVVQGAQSPEPQFDTADLGTDVTLTPISDFTEVVDQAERSAQGEIIRITVLGTTPGGLNALVVHSEENNRVLGPMQLRCVQTDTGRSCGGTQLENLVDEPGGLIPPEDRAHPTYTIGGKADLTWEVPAETSVVMLTVNGERSWQRPVARVAVFDTELVDGDRFELTSFDATGVSIARHLLVARTD